MKDLKGSMLPSDHWETTMDSLKVGGGKYSDEPSSAPYDLEKANNGLASYLKKNRQGR